MIFSFLFSLIGTVVKFAEMSLNPQLRLSKSIKGDNLGKMFNRVKVLDQNVAFVNVNKFG